MPRKLSKSEKTKNRRLIALYYLQGKTQAEIAEKIGRTQQYVSLVLKGFDEEWRNHADVDFAEAKARELAKIDHLEQKYWNAWFRSLGGFKSTTVKGNGGNIEKSKGGKFIDIERSERMESTHGDPRFLAGVQWCVERRARLFGFDQPVKVSVVDEIKRQVIAHGLTADDFSDNPILAEIATRYNI